MIGLSRRKFIFGAGATLAVVPIASLMPVKAPRLVWASDVGSGDMTAITILQDADWILFAHRFAAELWSQEMVNVLKDQMIAFARMANPDGNYVGIMAPEPVADREESVFT